MSSAGPTSFLGRGRVGGRELAYVVQTDGEAPTPDARAIELPDPFADPDGDPWVGAAAAPVAGGFDGPLFALQPAPPVRPRKVVGVGRNFGAHARELGNEVPTTPLLFLKAPTCLIATGEPIVLPRGYERIDMEAELVVVVGRRARSVPAERAFEHVAGYTLGNDVSNRDLQQRDGQWTRAKGHDGFGPLGPWIRLAPPGSALAPTGLRIRGYLDGELRQDAELSDLIFDIPTLIAHISESMTLEPGDLVFTGTPAGVCALSPGQRCRVELQGLALGVLENPVA
jgi:2-keto-4-pentenoate hydratase/2-oxohepta-3-ene-1,7-dioic acid hydratase in catechol pathway